MESPHALRSAENATPVTRRAFLMTGIGTIAATQIPRMEALFAGEEPAKPEQEKQTAHSTTEWIRQHVTPEYLNELKTCITDMNDGTSKDSWHIRQRGSRQALIMLTSLQQNLYPFPSDIQSLIDWRREDVSLEVQVRLYQLQNLLERAANFRSALPPMESDIGSVLNDIQAHLGVRVQLRDAQAIAMPMTIEHGSNEYAQILEKICQATGTYPEMGNDRFDLRLLRQDPKNKRILHPMERALMVEEEVAGDGRFIHCFSDPELALAHGEYCYECDPVIAEMASRFTENQAVWNGVNSVSPGRWRMHPSGTATWNSIPTLQYSGLVADHRVRKRMKLNGKQERIGFQSFRIDPKAKENGYCTNIDIGNYCDIRNYEMDGALKTSHVELLDANGESLHDRRDHEHVTGARRSMDLHTPSEPHSAKISGYTNLHKQHVSWNTGTGKLTMKMGEYLFHEPRRGL